MLGVAPPGDRARPILTTQNVDGKVVLHDLHGLLLNGVPALVLSCVCLLARRLADARPPPIWG
jgi:hypothetical protein